MSASLKINCRRVCKQAGLRWSLQVLHRALNAERCFWMTGYPSAGTPTLPTLPLLFLLGLLTPILSMGSVNLSGEYREEIWNTGWQEAEGLPRLSRGQHLILPHYGKTRLKVRFSGWAAKMLLLGSRRNVCTLPLTIFCLTWIIGFWFMTLGHVFVAHRLSDF